MSRKQSLKDKSRNPISLKEKMSRNDIIKGKKDWEKFEYNISNNFREALLLDKKNGNSLWSDAISKEIIALERLGVFQFYSPKAKFENKYGYKYAPMHVIFAIKKQGL